MERKIIIRSLVLSLSLSRPFVSAVGISRGEKRERLANNDSRWPNLQPDFGCLFPLLWNRLLLPFHSDSSCHSPYSTPYTRVVLASMLARFNRENRGRLRKASSLFLSLSLSRISESKASLIARFWLSIALGLIRFRICASNDFGESWTDGTGFGH